MGTSRLLIAGLNFATIPLLTRILDSREYGSYVLFASIVTIASTVVVRWLNAAILRYASKDRDWNVAWLIISGFLLSAPFVAVTIVIPLLLISTPFSIVAVATTWGLIDAMFATVFMASRARLATGAFFVGGVSRAFLIVATLVTILAVDLENSVTLSHIMALNALAGIVGTALSCWLIRFPPMRRSPGLAVWFSLGWPLIVSQALLMAIAHSGKFFIYGFHGPSELGRFAPTFDLLNGSITLLMGFVGLATVPRIYSTDDSQERSRNIRHLRTRILIVGTSLLLGVGILWPFAADILIPQGAQLADRYTHVVLAGAFVISGFQVQYQNVLLLLHKASRSQAWSSVAGAAVCLLSGWALVPISAPMGAAGALLLGSVTSSIVAAASLVALQRRDSEGGAQ